MGLFVFSSGCDSLGKLPWVSKDPYQEADDIISNAIYQINTGQKNWQDALQEAQDKLTQAAQSTIRTEVNNLMQGAIASGGAELRCNVDFIRTRVVQDLERIRARIRGEQVAPLYPWVCKAVPESIDMGLSPDRRPSVTFYGFDFPLNTPPRPQVLHYQGAAGSDVSNALSLTSSYEMVLDLGTTGVPLSSQSTRLSVSWNGSLLSEIAVHQPPLPACTEKPDYIPSQSLTVVPQKFCRSGYNCDNSFNGEGPQIQYTVRVGRFGDHVDAHLEIGAWENPLHDGTQASGQSDTTIYSAPVGYTIESVQGPLMDTKTYLVPTYTKQTFSGSGPVYSYEIVGGPDVGNIYMTVWLRQINLVLKQNKNCI